MFENNYNNLNNIHFCKKCVESNQRFMSTPQHDLTNDHLKPRALFDDSGVCLSCRYYEKKKEIDWTAREGELGKILSNFRKKNGEYDVLVPGSGGKDSIFTAIYLKEKFNMNPLTCTWAPGIFTEIGWKNLQSWIKSGFDNILFTPNKKVHSLLTKLSFLNLLHPFQPFAIGQSSFPMKVALEKNIKLVVYGDGMSERGIGKTNLDDLNIHGEKDIKDWQTYNKNKKIYLAGLEMEEIKKEYSLSNSDLKPYMPVDKETLRENNINILHITDFVSYNPQKNFYFAKEKSQFEVNPDGRSEGTYTKYVSLDDQIDGLHHYTWFIKTGRGRATEDACIEIRNEIISRDEGVSLVKKYDGEFPKKYFKNCLQYMNISEEKFFETIDKFRPKHIWKKDNNKWVLKHAVWHV